MNWLKTLCQELLSLFVDDEQLALSVVLWLGALALLRATGAVPSRFLAPMLFVGLAVILARSVMQGMDKP